MGVLQQMLTERLAERAKRAQSASSRIGRDAPTEYPGDHVHGPIVDTRPVQTYERGDADDRPEHIIGPKPAGDDFEFVDSDAFDAGDFTPEWLIPGVLVKGQPGVIAGPSKGMKTSVAVDMAVSLAAGAPFLGQFPILKPVRVAVVSGESGMHTLQETGRRIALSKETTLRGIGGRLKWCFRLPTVTDIGVMTRFADKIASSGVEAAVIDPLYLCLGGRVDPRSMFEMGPALQAFSETLLRTGCTPILCHHANGRLQTGEPMELQHLAYSGLEQFARQFLLLNRRQAYTSDGTHELWIRAGGSIGHGGLWAVHIDEGLTGDTFGGRRWNVSVMTTDEVKADRAAEQEQTRREKVRLSMRQKETDLLNLIDREAEHGSQPPTKARIRAALGWSASATSDVVGLLIEAGYIEECEYKKTGGSGSAQKVTGYRRAQCRPGGPGGNPPALVHPVRGRVDRVDK
ncbi:MAG: AAA family ATPase [Bacteroidales bacterium]|nr:AAA family ATPase [Bacteroidales bacterium]